MTGVSRWHRYCRLMPGHAGYDATAGIYSDSRKSLLGAKKDIPLTASV